MAVSPKTTAADTTSLFFFAPLGAVSMKKQEETQIDA